MGDDALQHFFDPEAPLGGDRDGGEGVEPEVLVDLLAYALHVGRGQIDLVDHRQKLEIVLEREIEVRDRLRLHSLRRIDHHQRPLAGHQGAPDLVGEVDVAGGVDEIELVEGAVLRPIVEAHRVALDGDAALALDIHVVEHLVAEAAFLHRPARLDQSIRERRLAVVDVRDDAEVADLVHGTREVPDGVGRKANTGSGRATPGRWSASSHAGKRTRTTVRAPAAYRATLRPDSGNRGSRAHRPR